MDIVEIRSTEQLDGILRQELPELIKDAWRKVYVNMDAYSNEYERNEQIWGIGMIEEELAKGNRWFAMRENGTYVAAVLVDDVEHEGQPALQLRTLAVHPREQGRGLAQQLVEHIAKIGASEGKQFVTLYTSSLLASLVRFYERIGFAEYRREEVERFGKRYARVFLSRAIRKT
ncbi:MAG: GNAT family N-acetyltransferase [Tumebacillaceae bacterium]